jgi:hypothetical protein
MVMSDAGLGGEIYVLKDEPVRTGRTGCLLPSCAQQPISAITAKL